MKKILRVFSLLTVLALLFCFFPTAMPVLAQSAAVTINAPSQVFAGGNFTATVDISSVSNLDAAQYAVSFNSTQLRLDNVTAGNIGGTGIPVVYWERPGMQGTFTIINNLPGPYSETDIVSANVSHFTQFAVIAKFPPQPQPTAPPEQPPVPAEFKLTDLLINPAEAISGSPVAVSIVLNNTGGSEGNYTVVLKINGTEEDKKNITLKAGEKEAVTFTVTKQKEGSYTVSIDDISGQFTITAAPPAVPEPKPGLHWPLIVSIAGGVIILGLILRFTVFRRRAW